MALRLTSPGGASPAAPSAPIAAPAATPAAALAARARDALARRDVAAYAALFAEAGLKTLSVETAYLSRVMTLGKPQ